MHCFPQLPDAPLAYCAKPTNLKQSLKRLEILSDSSRGYVQVGSALWGLFEVIVVSYSRLLNDILAVWAAPGCLLSKGCRSRSPWDIKRKVRRGILKKKCSGELRYPEETIVPNSHSLGVDSMLLCKLSVFAKGVTLSCKGLDGEASHCNHLCTAT